MTQLASKSDKLLPEFTHLAIANIISNLIVGFVPTAIAAWHWQQVHLLWLALTLFMICRAGSLGVLVRRTLVEVNR